MNISWLNIVVFQLLSDKKRPDDETIQYTHHVENCFLVYTFMLETYIYNSVSHTIECCIYFNKINKYISYVKR